MGTWEFLEEFQGIGMCLCGRSQKCVRASRQLATPLVLRCNVRCTFVDDRPVCGYGRSLRRCPSAAAHTSVADRSAGARGTEFTTQIDLQSQTGTSGPKRSENQGARMFNNTLGVSPIYHQCRVTRHCPAQQTQVYHSSLVTAAAHLSKRTHLHHQGTNVPAPSQYWP